MKPKLLPLNLTSHIFCARDQLSRRLIRQNSHVGASALDRPLLVDKYKIRKELFFKKYKDQILYRRTHEIMIQITLRYSMVHTKWTRAQEKQAKWKLVKRIRITPMGS